MNNRLLIGCEEWCSLPKLQASAIKVRVDSGAKTSALHAEKITPFEKNGEKWVRFVIFPLQNNAKINIECEARIIDERIIKSSTGTRERRFVIATILSINNEEWEIEITLTNRDSMGYRMLLGREAMAGKIVVDPNEHFVLGDHTDEEVREKYNIATPAKKGLKIGVLASNPDLYSNKRIMEAGEIRGHDMNFLSLKHCYMKLDARKPEIHYRGGTVLSDYDAIIPRIRPSMTYYGCSLIRHFESMNVFSLNSAEAITQSRDKLYSLQLLLKNGVEIPTTGFANSPLDTSDLISMVGGSPLIIKLLEGTQGKGVVLAETKKAAESVINAFKSLNANILVQEFIKEANGKDLRLFVINNKVVAAMQREALPGEFRANIHLGGTASVVKITAEEKRVALKAAKAMDLKVAGVDIIRSSKGPLLLEVNSSPGLEGIENATGIDIASEMIQSIERKLKWKNS